MGDQDPHQVGQSQNHRTALLLPTTNRTRFLPITRLLQYPLQQCKRSPGTRRRRRKISSRLVSSTSRVSSIHVDLASEHARLSTSRIVFVEKKGFDGIIECFAEVYFFVPVRQIRERKSKRSSRLGRESLCIKPRSFLQNQNDQASTNRQIAYEEQIIPSRPVIPLLLSMYQTFGAPSTIKVPDFRIYPSRKSCSCYKTFTQPLLNQPNFLYPPHRASLILAFCDIQIFTQFLMRVTLRVPWSNSSKQCLPSRMESKYKYCAPSATKRRKRRSCPPPRAFPTDYLSCQRIAKIPLRSTDPTISVTKTEPLLNWHFTPAADPRPSRAKAFERNAGICYDMTIAMDIAGYFVPAKALKTPERWLDHWWISAMETILSFYKQKRLYNDDKQITMPEELKNVPLLYIVRFYTSGLCNL